MIKQSIISIIVVAIYHYGFINNDWAAKWAEDLMRKGVEQFERSRDLSLQPGESVA